MTTPRLSQRSGLLEEIHDHVNSDLDHEVGGILVGTLGDGKTSVDASIPALRAVGHRAQVTFTHDVWDDILEQVDRDHPGQRIVGWYHSHPGFGIFLSEYDKFIHRSFFSKREMVALVVDPHSNEHGWFGWDDEEEIVVLERSPEADLLKSSPPAVPGASSHGRTILAVGVVAIVAFAGGYGMGLAGDSARVDGPESAAEPQSPDDPGRPPASQVEPSPEPSEPDDHSPGNTDLVTPPEGAPSIQYRIQAGDTLSKLALAFYDDLSALDLLLEANPHITDPDLIQSGQLLHIPSTRTEGEPEP